MKFLLDENFPKAAILLLESCGHQAEDIRGTKKEGAEDSVIFQLAQDLNAVFLTTDKDFFHTVPHLFEEHHGVVVIILRQPNRENILSKLDWHKFKAQRKREFSKAVKELNNSKITNSRIIKASIGLNKDKSDYKLSAYLKNPKQIEAVLV